MLKLYNNVANKQQDKWKFTKTIELQKMLNM